MVEQEISILLQHFQCLAVIMIEFFMLLNLLPLCVCFISVVSVANNLRLMINDSGLFF